MQDSSSCGSPHRTKKRNRSNRCQQMDDNSSSSSDEEAVAGVQTRLLQGIPSIDSTPESHGTAGSMGRLYTGQSGSDGDVETDCNLDSHKSGATKDGRYSVNSSLSSLDDRTINTEVNHSVASNEVLSGTLPIQRGPHFNIPPPPLINHDTAPPSESSGHYSHSSYNNQHMGGGSHRDTDSDNNNRGRNTGGEYHITTPSFPRTLAARPSTMSDKFCVGCHDNQQSISHMQHQGGCCQHAPLGTWNQSNGQPHSMNRSNTGCTASASYDPPWDLAYPFNQMQLFHQQNHQGTPHTCHTGCSMHGGTTPDVDRQNVRGNSIQLNSMSQHRNPSTHQPATRTVSSQDGNHNTCHGMNTLATTGSHSYETPWDILPNDRHAHPPPCSPPPPPPDALRRPVLHYDGAALQEGNVVQHLPQKKPPRRQCNWKCIAIFLMVAIFALSACVAAFTALLVKGNNSPPINNIKGAESARSHVTDGNLGDRHRSDIPPHSFVRVRFYVPRSQFYKFNLTLDENTLLGVYGRRSIQPSHTQFDFFEQISGKQIADSKLPAARKKRSIGDVNTGIVRYLDEGYWYISLYNDGDETERVKFSTSKHDKMDTGCPNDCNGKGDCTNGVCRCFPGYTGLECALKVCPLLCNGNGIYDGGHCSCFDRWKGAECSVRSHHCDSCSVHGHCVEGECLCDNGWQGDTCDEVACPSSDCSDHGICHEGRCFCELGHRGLDCGIDEAQNFTIACSNNCTGHGVFNSFEQTCHCDSGWRGNNCEEKECSFNCGNGYCSNGRCVCNDGWTGTSCAEKLCDARCDQHGTCSNGTCHCMPGWNGKHCTLNGCVNSCNGHGECTHVNNQWRCACTHGWKGSACGKEMELQCADNIDNDRDNLVDCFDPDCCTDSACITGVFCQLSADPIDILLRKPKLNSMASFYETKRFLIEGDGDESIQKGTSRNSFTERRVSVLRGHVYMRDGSPALGTRVSIEEQPTSGFTLTRANGTFDIMVNGGGSVTVTFTRSVTQPCNVTVIVPWNKLITLDPVFLLQVDDEPLIVPSCTPAHDRYTLHPVVLPTWQHSQLRACPDTSAVIPESQVVQESIAIPGSDVHLVYKSSDTTGYRSTILVQLTPEKIPDDLSRVHLKINVEGVVHEEVFEADPNLTYRFSWQRRNAYQQYVYGIVTAQVSVGYVYRDCELIHWDKQATTLSGFLGGDLSSSDRSISEGWSLDIQHFYNYQEGLLHKGDGTNIYLKEKPHQLVTVIGTGEPRIEACPNCDGSAANQKLLAPVALASDLDGAVYVADYNLIRKLSPGMESVNSVLELVGGAMSYRYYMTVSPQDGKLYIADALNRRILRVKDTSLSGNIDITDNYEIIAGTGERCVKGASDKCGDGGLARDAQLTMPRGIAVSRFGEIYFVDDISIRKIGLDGIIQTVVGDQGFPAAAAPFPCGRAAELYEVFLRWPTSVAFSPVDDSLYILDKVYNLVLKITPENKVVIVAGRPDNCVYVTAHKSGLGLLSDDTLQIKRARDTDLIEPVSMTFSPNGDLYIVESNGKMTNRVRKISTDGYISHYAGGKPSCDCEHTDCPCWLEDETVASKALFNKPTSMTVTPDGVLYLADMGNLRVHSIITTLPASKRGHYSVVSSAEGEVYTFDRHGFHVQTRDIMTDNIMYNFTMQPKNSLQGVLVEVSGIGDQNIAFTRDHNARLKAIKLNDVEVAKIKVNHNRQLHSFIDLNNVTSEFAYDLSTGLLESKQTSKGETFFYEYDETGRLSKVTMPTGELLRLDADVDSKGAIVTLRKNAVPAGTATYNGNYLSLRHGQKSADVTYSNDGSIVVEYPSGLVVTLETGSHPTLGSDTPTALKRKIISSNDGPVHRLEWRYYIRRNQLARIGKKFRVRPAMGTGDETYLHDGYAYNTKDLMVNGENLLAFEFLLNSSMEVVKDGLGANLVTVQYTLSGLPSIFLSNSSLKFVNITYNQAGQMVHWKRDRYKEERTYSDSGQLTSIKLPLDVEKRFLYRSGGTKPTDVILPSGIQYQIKYDQLGNMVQLIGPNSGVHNFIKALDIGFVRQTYRFDHGTRGQAYIEDYDGSGQLIRSIYPSSQRRVYRRYTVDGRPREILFGSQQIAYDYNSTTNSLTSVTLHHPTLQQKLVYKTNGSLYDQHSVEFKSKLNSYRYVSAQYNYQYNRLLRIEKISGLLTDGSQQMPVELQYEYSTSSGHLSKIDDFTIRRGFVRGQYQIITEDDTAQILQKFDSKNSLSNVHLKIGDRTVYTSTIAYDALRRIKQWTTLIGDFRQTVQYTYTRDSQVTMVTVNEGREHKYTYNSQGSLTHITHGDQTKVLELDNSERVSIFNGIQYEYDLDGFIAKRGNIRYDFNAKGQLTRVLESGRTDISYLYDAAGRLIQRKNNHGSAVQLFYANVMKPTQITHVYNMTSKILQTLHYNSDGCLFAINSGSTTRYYVVADHSCTPVAMYDRSGALSKRLDFSVLGELIHDTQPDLKLYLGFQGGFFDPVTGLVHLSGRWYDTELGRWLDAGLNTIFSRALKLSESPVLINPYQYQTVINLHLLDKDSFYMKDLRTWLIAMGYNLDVLAPTMSFDGELKAGTDMPPAVQSLLPLVSAFQCAYEQDMENFLDLSVVPRSKLVASRSSSKRMSLVPSGSLFSPGVVLSVEQGLIHTSVLGRIPSQEEQLVTRIVNGSQALGLNYTLIDKVTHYLVKKELGKLDDDLQLLDIQSGNNINSVYLANGIRVTVGRYQWRDPETNKLVSQGSLSIHGNGSVINIRYGSTVTDERQRVLQLAYDHAKEYAWLKEQAVVMNEGRSQYPWTSSEINELRHKGQIPGYQAEWIKQPSEYPELAADPANIIFRRVES